ncbi:hypothetical protein EC957_004576 [Mortierella hygrophila]|uniref:F-box domain-containing protein n=1 Tax=Mortierella hygrophila TaxID=979708 RepID=A0A9P6K096_9FUNG|nr:hypothetical protein EC957_004576 [Mortierella hygrophila]
MSSSKAARMHRSNISAKPQMQVRTHDQIDKRVPPEIWEQIFNHLYPSQLSRISMVNKNLNVIVSSLEVWPRMFYAAHGPKAQLRPLMSIPKFKSSSMIFMCASSLHICEKCFGLTGYNADKLYMLPLPIPVLLPRRSTDAIKYVGGRFDPNWTIRMCLPCRQGHISDLEEPIPLYVLNGQIDWNSLRDKYPCAGLTPEFRRRPFNNRVFWELDAFNCIRQYFGGDVGIKAYNVSTEACDEMTATRIRWYQLQG